MHLLGFRQSFRQSFRQKGETGNAALGRLYHLALDHHDVLGPATLTVVYNADQVLAAWRGYRGQSG